MVPRKVLISSPAPDAINTNAIFRTYMTRGFRAALPDSEIASATYELSVQAASALLPALTVIVGSVMPDQTDYHVLADVVHRHGGRVAFWLHDDPYEFDANDRIFGLADV